MIHGLLSVAAMGAATMEPAQADAAARADESFGRAGSVVLGDVVAARALTPTSGVALGGGPVTAAWLTFGSTRSGDSGVKSISAEPSFDVFVADGVSVGALLGGGVVSVDFGSAGSPRRESEVWHVTAMPRVGDPFALSKDVVMWPRFAAGVSLYDAPGQPKLGTVIRATFDVPFVFRLSRHVMLQAGPQVSYVDNLSGPNDVRGFAGGGSGGLSIVL